MWFKIFNSSLFLVIAVINITAAAILANNQSLMISHERSRAVSDHEFICATLKNNITYERMKSDLFAMSKKEIDKVVESTILRQADENTLVVIYDEKGEVTRYGEDRPDISDLRSAIKGKDDIFSVVADSGEKSFLCVGSQITLDGQMYTIVTEDDITDIYTERDRELMFVQIISVAFASVTAVILLIIIKVFLSPLADINRSINDIANGDYSKRLKVRGSEELRSLSANINEMAGSIEENYNRIEAVAEERKRFIDSLAHEIKTPLTSILGFADILRIKKNITPEELGEYSSIIVDEAKRLRTLSGKLMELISSGNSELEMKPVGTDMILNDLKIVFMPIAKAKNISLTVSCESLMINADEDIFKSLIYNLLDNAVKASYDGGEILLSCRRDGEYAVISVQDSGIGISEEDMEHIFEAFYMADKSRSRKQGGSGLGLALCAEIAKKHNAKIGLQSTLGKGTTVRIRIKTAGGKVNEIQ